MRDDAGKALGKHARQSGEPGGSRRTAHGMATRSATYRPVRDLERGVPAACGSFGDRPGPERWIPATSWPISRRPGRGRGWPRLPARHSGYHFYCSTRRPGTAPRVGPRSRNVFVPAASSPWLRTARGWPRISTDHETPGGGYVDAAGRTRASRQTPLRHAFHEFAVARDGTWLAWWVLGRAGGDLGLTQRDRASRPAPPAAADGMRPPARGVHHSPDGTCRLATPTARVVRILGCRNRRTRHELAVSAVDRSLVARTGPWTLVTSDEWN
jgi:hypothetical protein